jgi:hypothetical protein
VGVGGVMAAVGRAMGPEGVMTCVGADSNAAPWQACSKAVAKARTLPKRSLGSFASAISTTSSSAGARSASFSRSGGGGSGVLGEARPRRVGRICRAGVGPGPCAGSRRDGASPATWLETLVVGGV